MTTYELAATHATQQALKRSKPQGLRGPRVRLIINRYLHENGLSEDAIETGLPNDYDSVQAAILDARMAASASRLCRALDELCERLTGFTQTPKKTWLHSVTLLRKNLRERAKVLAAHSRPTSVAPIQHNRRSRAVMTRIIVRLHLLLQNQSGQDLIEYAMMAGFVALAAGATVPSISTSISTVFSKVGSVMTTAGG